MTPRAFLRSIVSAVATLNNTTAPLLRALDQQAVEIANLRAELAEHRARKPLTENEDRAVAAVRVNEGAIVRDIAKAMAGDRNRWNPGREVSDYDIDLETKHIYGAFCKGALRREQDGRTYRYWTVAS